MVAPRSASGICSAVPLVPPCPTRVAPRLFSASPNYSFKCIKHWHLCRSNLDANGYGEKQNNRK